jgi:hypothetical protein
MCFSPNNEIPKVLHPEQIDRSRRMLLQSRTANGNPANRNRIGIGVLPFSLTADG